MVWAGVATAFFAGAALRAAPTTALANGIPSQPLAEALIRYAHETGLQVVYVSGLVRNQRSTEVPAGLAPQAALGRLLEGTGLRFQFVNARLVRIISAPSATGAAAGADTPPAAPEEVLITARRSEAPENRIPVSLTVWTQESMEVAGVRSTADIAAYTPGVEFDHYPEFGAGYSTNIAIRGINSNSGSTVGLYVDDTPLPATSGWGAGQNGGYGRAFPLTFDLERVEVLRGPQGTSFGSHAMGGVIRYISKLPDLESYEGQVHSEVSTTERGAASYEAGAAAGGPIVADYLGFRASAWYRKEGGYVDRVDPFTGATVEANSSSSQSSVVRGALTLAPSQALHITPSLTYQDVRPHDTSSFFAHLSDPAAGILRNGKLLRQPDDDAYYLASLKISATAGGAELTAVTSYFDRHLTALTDLTNRGYGFGSPFGDEYPTAYGDAISKTTDVSERTFSQELRLASAQPASKLRWTMGVFYSHGHNRRAETRVAGPIPPRIPADGFNGVLESESQLAGFGEAALSLGKHLTASAGVRVTHFAYDSFQYAGGPANDGVPHGLRVKDSRQMVTPRFGLDYQVNSDTLIYGSVSSGAEPGGFNAATGGCVGVYPLFFGPDSLWSYEVGSKSAVLDGRAQLSVSVFHMSWRDKQQALYAGPEQQALYPGPNLCAYTANLGTAASDGFEASAQALIGSHLTAALGVAYADARYTQTVRSGNVVSVTSGDAIGALPLVPSPLTLSGTLDYRFPVGADITANLYLADYFHNRNPGPFYTDNPESPAYALGRRPDPSVNVLNLRGALSWSHLELALYLDNALDAHPTLSLRNECTQCRLFYATTLRPRTLGLAATWRF
jgi:outer membrane receptor protein involved in Fe transport